MVRQSIQQISLQCFTSSSSSEINHQQPFTVNQCLTLIVCPGIFACICFVLLFIAHCPTFRYSFVCLVRYVCSAQQEGSCIGLNSEYWMVASLDQYVLHFSYLCILHTDLHHIQMAALHWRATERVITVSLITSQTNDCKLNGDCSGQSTSPRQCNHS